MTLSCHTVHIVHQICQTGTQIIMMMLLHFSAAMSLECNGSTTETTGTLQYPGYPSNYDNNVHCTYEITPQGVTSISLNITYYHVGSSCDDYVEVSTILCEKVVG